VFGLVYLVSVLVGRRYIEPSLGIATIWPAAGVAAGGLALAGRRRSHVAALVVANVTGNLMTGAGAGAAIGFAFANTVGAVVGASILDRATGDSIAALRRLWRLVLAAGAVAVVAGTLGTAAIVLTSDAAVEARAAFVSWAVADAVGVLVFAPVMLAVASRAPFPGWRQAARNVAVGAAAAASVLGIAYVAGTSERPVTYLAVPAFVVASMLIGGRNLIVTVAAVSLAIGEMTHAGFGPFAEGVRTTDVLSMQAFTAVLTCSALFVTAINRRSVVLAQQMAQTLEAAGSAVLVVAGDSIVAFANPAAARALGADVVGRPLGEVVGADVAAALLEGDGPHEVMIHTADGPVPFDITTGRFDDEDGPSTVLVARDVTERKLAERRIRNLSAVVEMSPSFVGFCDPNGRIEYLSPGARQMVGLGNRELEGLRFSSLAPDWAVSLMRDVAVPAAIESGHWRGEGAYLGPDGSEIPVAQVVMAHRDERGQLEMVSVIAHDLSERVRMEQERSEFVANLVHDLRNPLVAISGAAEILAEDAAVGRPIEVPLVEIVDAGAAQIRRLVGDLIAGEQIAGERSDKRELVNLHGLASQVVSLHVLPAARNSVSLVVEGEVVHVHGNRSALHRMIENLVTNAVKYSPRGGSVTVVVGTEGGEALLSIRDEGIGIAAADMPGMFERYSRGSTAAVAGIAGTGLGLAICRQVAESHGGSISVASRPGRGSTFQVRLPMAPATAIHVDVEAPAPVDL
jgi:PAS domain S-box-containing protein